MNVIDRIIQLRNLGMSSTVIAAELGLHKERVQSLLAQLRKKGLVRRLGLPITSREDLDRVVGLREEGLSSSKIAALIGKTRRQVDSIVHYAQNHSKLPPPRPRKV
jgi:DNA invertase Pin-like site-specific DNA recombinase